LAAIAGDFDDAAHEDGAAEAGRALLVRALMQRLLRLAVGSYQVENVHAVAKCIARVRATDNSPFNLSPSLQLGNKNLDRTRGDGVLCHARVTLYNS
jgi:hypothetical protein